jgi:hypothetical protein
VLEQASASGIVLEWSGSDSKDAMTIVGSNLQFDMLSTNAVDAAFINFFTGDEHRFHVLIKSSTDDAIVWQGYIIPDLYDEPYKSGSFFVRFAASCGLGRLKGKFLPEEYYKREKSLIDIYTQLLLLTGLELDLYFSPAIENFVNKDWDTIYIDGLTFLEKDKKQDAYSILETLLQDTLCLCYQADNRWYIEGINTRQLRQVKYKIYKPNTGLFSSLIYDRLLKKVTVLATPNITMIPPYNQIIISNSKIAPFLPPTASKELNNGWAIVTGVNGRIDASSWIGHNEFYASAINPNYEVSFYNKAFTLGAGYNNSYAQDDSQYISLREKLYFSKGQKVAIALEFKIIKPFNNQNSPDDMLLWKNPFKYEIIFNGEVINSNFNNTVSDIEQLVFENSGLAKIDIEHILLSEGLLDFKFYGPTGSINTTYIEGISISKIEVDVIAFIEEDLIIDLINGDFTVDKDIELVYGNDKSGFSKGFKLYKLKEQTSFFNDREVPILDAFTFDQKNYSVVSLFGANLINENKYTVYRDGVLIDINAVYFNFNDGGEMVVETAVLYGLGVFTVKKYAVDDVVDSRGHWVQWTDAVYKIENSSYLKTVANIYRRIFNLTTEKIDMSVRSAVKFNDIVLFYYTYLKDFHVLNCSWNLDENKSKITVGRSIYKDAAASTEGDDNTPPIVLAGDDIYLTDQQTTTNLMATAYDPDGDVVAQQWVKIEGPYGDTIDSPFQLETNLQNLTGDFYKYQITVTDNDGAAASDTIDIIRNIDYTVSLDLVFEDDYSNDEASPYIIKKYKLNVSPNLRDNSVMTLKGIIKTIINVQGYSNGYDAYSGYVIEKNGYILEAVDVNGATSNVQITLNLIYTDEIFITIRTDARQGVANPGDYAFCNSAVQINSAVFTKGSGTILGFPLDKGQSVQASSPD